MSEIKAKEPCLRERLKRVPSRVFWKRGLHVDKTPNFEATFAYIAREVYAGSLKSTTTLLAAIADGKINLSTFQRSVAVDAIRRDPSREKTRKPKA